MAYATVADLRAYLPQIESGAAMDALLAAILDRATAIVDGEIGHAWSSATEAAQVVYGDGTPTLVLPAPVAGQVTSITAPPGAIVPTYARRGDLLIAVDGRVWARGIPYTVTAPFGYGPPPADVVEATLEIAASIWREKDSGFATVLGVEGAGAIETRQAFSPRVRSILNRYRATRRYAVAVV